MSDYPIGADGTSDADGPIIHPDKNPFTSASLVPSSAASAFVQTLFMGATVVSFSSRIGWGTNSSEVTVELVDDPGCGTSSKAIVYNSKGQESDFSNTAYRLGFNPGPIGQTQSFNYGSFGFSGILQSWETNRSMSGEIHTVRLVSPTVVLSNARVILNGMDDWSPPAQGNVINLHYSLGFPSWCNDTGVTWTNLRSVIIGHTFNYRGQQFTLSGLGVPACGLRFGGDSVDVMSAIDRAAKALGMRIFCDLTGNDISVRASGGSGGKFNTGSIINTALTPTLDGAKTTTAADALTFGAIFRSMSNRAINTNRGGCDGSGELISESSGVEANEVCSTAIINGEFEHRLWQIEDGGESGGGSDGATGTIKNYWGSDPEDGKPLVSEEYEHEKYSNDIVPFEEGFKVNIKEQKFAPLLTGDTYYLTLFEIRAAQAGFDQWYEMMCYFEADGDKFQGKKIIEELSGETGELGVLVISKLLKSVKKGKKDVAPATTAKNKGQAWINANKKKKTKTDELRALHSFVAGFGSFYGKQFTVELPEDVYCCGDSANPPALNKSYEQTDSGFPMSDTSDVLGLSWKPPAGSDAGLELFKSDDGRVRPIMVFDDTDVEAKHSIDLSKLGKKTWYVKSSKYYISASFDKIIPHPDHFDEPCTGDGDVKVYKGLAVLSAGPVVQTPDVASDKEVPKGLNNRLLWHMLGAENESELSDTDTEALAAIQNQHTTGHVIRGLSLAPKPLLAKKAAVPLKSNIFRYGSSESDPWINDGGDHGRAEYEAETRLSPWTFGDYKGMRQAGASIIASKTSGQGTLESGSQKIVGLPSDAGIGFLGDTLAGGPPTTSVNISVGAGGVTTTIQYRTHVRNFGDLAQSRFDFMEQQAGAVQSFQRAFNLKKAERANRAAVISQNEAQSAGGGETVPQAGAGGAEREADEKFNAGTDTTVITATNHKDPESDTSRGSSGESFPADGRRTTASLQSVDRVAGEADTASWDKTAAVGMEGLFRPFEIGSSDNFAEYSLETTSPCPSSATFNAGLAKEKIFICCPSDGPKPSTPPSPSPCTKSIDAKYHNPYMSATEAGDLALGTVTSSVGHDIQTLTHSGSLPSEGLAPKANASKIRSIGLKGPVVIVGWGYDVDGKPVPNKAESEPFECEFEDDWLSKPHHWKAGPLDIVWNDKTKMWQANNRNERNIIVYARLLGDLDPGGTQEAQTAEDSGGDPQKITVSNRLGQPLCKDQHIFAYFNSDGCEWVVIQAEFMPVCVVTDLKASPSDMTGSDGGACLDLKATTRMIYTQTPPTIGLESRWAQVKACDAGFALISLSPGTGDDDDDGDDGNNPSPPPPAVICILKHPIQPELEGTYYAATNSLPAWDGSTEYTMYSKHLNPNPPPGGLPGSVVAGHPIIIRGKVVGGLAGATCNVPYSPDPYWYIVPGGCGDVGAAPPPNDPAKQIYAGGSQPGSGPAHVENWFKAVGPVDDDGTSVPIVILEGECEKGILVEGAFEQASKGGDTFGHLTTDANGLYKMKDGENPDSPKHFEYEFTDFEGGVRIYNMIFVTDIAKAIRDQRDEGYWDGHGPTLYPYIAKAGFTFSEFWDTTGVDEINDEDADYSKLEASFWSEYTGGTAECQDAQDFVAVSDSTYTLVWGDKGGNQVGKTRPGWVITSPVGQQSDDPLLGPIMAWCYTTPDFDFSEGPVTDSTKTGPQAFAGGAGDPLEGEIRDYEGGWYVFDRDRKKKGPADRNANDNIYPCWLYPDDMDFDLRDQITIENDEYIWWKMADGMTTFKIDTNPQQKIVNPAADDTGDDGGVNPF